MEISIRKKKLADGRESIYLDCYFPNAEKKRVKEYLKLYTYPNPRNTKDREHNKKTMLLAESIRSKRFMEEQHEQHGFGHFVKGDTSANFIKYF